MTEDNLTCPLCLSNQQFTHLTGPKNRGYQQCHRCYLIFMERKFLPDPSAEKARYTAHQNDAENEGYVLFLQLAIVPTLPYLDVSMRGLDFGCGPSPTLSGLLNALGMQCENYDPYFYPALPDHQYDFIFATEVIEHFFNPADSFQRISELLLPGGILTLMTEPWTTHEGFAEWHYAKDMTHVCFYHAKTISYICHQFEFEQPNQGAGRVSILRKISPPH